MILASGSIFSQTQTLQVQISSSSDDAEERGANATSNPGLMDLTSSDIELTKDGNDGDQFVGLHFKNIAIPKGSIINNAYIQFGVDELDNVAGTKVFQIEDIDSASTFTNTAFDISSRLLTNDSVQWANIPQWTAVGDAGVDQQSPDLSSLIQSLINRAAWKSDNALNIIIHGTGERTAESFDGTSSLAPKLVIEFTSPIHTSFQISSNDDDAEEDIANGGMDLSSSDLEITNDGSSSQLIGMRFNNISIPSGSIIQSAYVQFTVDEANSGGDVDAYIAMEDADDATSILGSTANLSNRNFTSASVLWDNIPDWVTVGDNGLDQQTPDLKTLLQEVVDRAGWANGNSVLVGMVDPLVLSIPGYTGNTSKRVAESYNGSNNSSPQLVVSYIPPAIFQTGSFPIQAAASWKYNDSGVDLDSTPWESLNFNDSSWAFGNAILGYGNGNEATTVDYGPATTDRHITTYLRHSFNVSNASQYDSLVFDVLRDDGIVVYVNGVEAFRDNMPTGTIGFDTLALSTISGADELTYYRFKTGNLLQNGLNVIAVELHQAGASSSDLSFDMAVGFELPPLAPASFPFSKNSDWHYLDNGSSLDAIAWKDTLYNDDNWEQGPGSLGYGDVMNTTISFGNDANNKHITYYFRRDLNVDFSTFPDTVEFGLRRDDGAVVYLNGIEIIRENLPAGLITSSTLASTTISGSNETTYYTTLIPKSAFRNGRNQLAVEIHNRDIFSSDLGFDLYIKDAPIINPPALGCSNGNQAHIACFTSIAPTAQTGNMLIPTTSHRFQMLIQQGDAYTKGGGTVGGNNDFTGYVPTNGSSVLGHLGINHETTPGGLTILDMHYDAANKLWSVDTSEAVDFFNSDLVTTTRNCSGGVTPWGTILTAEETTNGGDVNNDGYDDAGWLVEIDPVTAKVVEYGNNKQEKVWGAGRMSHENAVVLNDSITLYTGEDGGSSAVFKFIANTKTDLSAGTLYALKLDGSLSGGDPTLSTGTWLNIPNSSQIDQNNTRSLAISLGATNFNGVEDIEVGTVDGKMYFTSKGNGRVYRFSDNGTTVSNFETFVGGTSYVINSDQGVFTEPWGSGNDNLTFDDQGNLWVLQDGGRNYVWVVRPDHTQALPKVELFMSAPAGSESCGLTFSPDYRFGFISIQHPSGSNTNQIDASGDTIAFDKSATIVFSRSEWLGAQAPIAAFEVDTQRVVVGNSVVFTDTSYNNPSQRTWTFNGGSPSTSTQKTETVMYNTIGLYPVKLMVSNVAGSDSLELLQYIEVIAPAPIVQFSANKTQIIIGDSVQFTDLSSHKPDTWAWTFAGGDPTFSADSMPTVVYNSAGFYDVSLIASNTAGSGPTESKTQYIEVVDNVSLLAHDLNSIIEVFPNPTKGNIRIDLDLEGGEMVIIEAFDLTGKKLAQLANFRANGSTDNYDFDLASFSNQNQSIVLKISVDERIAKRIIQIVH